MRIIKSASESIFVKSIRNEIFQKKIFSSFYVAMWDSVTWHIWDRSAGKDYFTKKISSVTDSSKVKICFHIKPQDFFGYLFRHAKYYEMEKNFSIKYAKKYPNIIINNLITLLNELWDSILLESLIINIKNDVYSLSGNNILRGAFLWMKAGDFYQNFTAFSRLKFKNFNEK